jgi:DNA invertase Pin-like site-specific DNA recombinase
MRIGYARVSTDDQCVDLQTLALEAARCERIFTDRGVSGSQFSRPGLDRALRALSKGDTLVVWRLDRLGRSLPKLVELVDHLGRRGIQFTSLTECIDTTSSGGTLLFHIMAALAQFERTLIAERTRAGMHAARERGQHLGRRRSLSEDQCREAERLLSSYPTALVAKRFQIHPRTLLRSLRRQGLKS